MARSATYRLALAWLALSASATAPGIAEARAMASAQQVASSDEPASASRLTAPRVEYDLSSLPKPVARLREQLVEAARSGDIEKLRPIIEGNEMVPTFSFGGGDDPIGFWKEASGDGQGREILAILLEVLEAGFVRVALDTEDVYVWPYFTEVPLSSLTPAQEVELYKLITAQDRRDMEEFGAYHFYRIGITSDGQWQYFVAGD